MTPAVLCHEDNFKTLRRTVARKYKDGAGKKKRKKTRAKVVHKLLNQGFNKGKRS